MKQNSPLILKMSLPSNARGCVFRMMPACTKGSHPVDKMRARHSQKEIISSSLQEEKVHFVLCWWKRNRMVWEKQLFVETLPILFCTKAAQINSPRGDRIRAVASVLTTLAPQVRAARTLALLHAACSLATRWHLWARTASVLSWLRGKAGIGTCLTELSQCGILLSISQVPRPVMKGSDQICSCPPSAAHANIKLILLVERVSLYFTSVPFELFLFLAPVREPGLPRVFAASV